MNIPVQLLGVLGLCASVAAFQCKKHKPIVLLRTLNELAFGLQYFFLGAYTGLAMNMIGSVRNLLFTHQVEKGRSTTGTMILFSIFFFVFGLFTWQGGKSLMVIVAKIISTVAYGNKNPTVVRILVLATSIAWLIYDALIFSIAGVASEAFTILSILVGIIRLDLPPLWQSLLQKRKSTHDT